MKYVTVRTPAGDRRGVLTSVGVVDLAAAAPIPAFASLLALIEAGPAAWAAAGEIADAPPAGALLREGDYTLRAPLPEPPQIRDCMAFHKHIEQASYTLARRSALAAGDVRKADPYIAGWKVPPIHGTQPVYYKANRFSIADPGEDIPWPSYSERMDFELELAMVIGRTGKDLSAETALDHVFGFMIFNDFSARDAQVLEMQGGLGPAKGKDFDKANAFGPCLVTLDELGDPHDLRMIARVNGEVWCDSNSSTIDWKFGDILAHISRGETLRPGEIIGSGTVGDGCGLEHDRYLQPGDVVELEVEGIGTLSNRLIRP
jgi:2-keto-4-pentenoate hydratase/2-oxohepta-3-ene-1,7-dioic acid hydratase in catechol pathway